jgi:hypothetical protein
VPRWAWVAGAAALLLVAPGCSARQKKLSTGGGMIDSVFYDVLGGKRDPSYYYGVVRDSHDPESFCYRCGDDVYLVDKTIDGIQHLGDGPFARLEGQANTITMLIEILLEDRSSLARSAAAVALTKIALGLPRYGTSGPADDGSGLAAAMGELTRMYGPPGRGRTPAGRTAGERDRVARLVAQIGDARYTQGIYTKKALQFFGTTDALIDETDPVIRTALDAALTRKSREAAVYALTAAVEGPADHVRADAIRGLKVLGEASAVSTVVARVRVDVSPRVRSEAAEYFGRVASRDAVSALLTLLDDVDGGVRWKAREALTRVAGQDLGARGTTWTRWARSRWPDLVLEDAKDAEGAPGGR